MKKIIRLTESDLTRIVKRVVNEQMNYTLNIPDDFTNTLEELGSSATPEDIIKFYNRLFKNQSSPLVDYDGNYFYNKSDEKYELEDVLELMEYALFGNEHSEYVEPGFTDVGVNVKLTSDHEIYYDMKNDAVVFKWREPSGYNTAKKLSDSTVSKLMNIIKNKY